MKITLAALVCLVLGSTTVLGAGLAFSEDEPPPKPKTHVEWVRDCLEDFKGLKPGMTRGEIEALWNHDGGLTLISEGRYLHPKCMYFKVDVTYDVQPREEGAVGANPNDKATKISRPYLETPYAD